MFSPQIETPLDGGMKMGLGWVLNGNQVKGHSIYGHDGATLGHRASMGLMPQHQLGVSFLTNSGTGDLLLKY
jgi:CubicO group peptidase (beta-lactamase class C family)